eukprot:scaffold1549_cov350-Prasinococcus_capsulatus_cf.AAC.11
MPPPYIPSHSIPFPPIPSERGAAPGVPRAPWLSTRARPAPLQLVASCSPLERARPQRGMCGGAAASVPRGVCDLGPASGGAQHTIRSSCRGGEGFSRGESKEGAASGRGGH